MSVRFIVPPYILEAIARRGDEHQRRRAMETLLLTERLRGRRDVAGAVCPVISPGEEQRVVYDERGSSHLPGRRVWREGEPASADPAVAEACTGAGTTYDFYARMLCRNSIDNKGMELDSSVHYGHLFDNAFWNGAQMVYGDGDGITFNRFTICLDVIAHELTHGVTEREAHLDYAGEPGALNESVSDVFGSLVKQWKLNQTVTQADWLIGAGLFTENVRGEALRSMKEPGSAYDDPVLGKDPQPAHMKDFYEGDDDNGGVHINSGIPNRAFYLASAAMGGRAWEKAGRIWYQALVGRLRIHSSFADAMKGTVAVAAELFGSRSLERAAVEEAWREVGVTAG